MSNEAKSNADSHRDYSWLVSQLNEMDRDHETHSYQLREVLSVLEERASRFAGDLSEAAISEDFELLGESLVAAIAEIRALEKLNESYYKAIRSLRLENLNNSTSQRCGDDDP